MKQRGVEQDRRPGIRVTRRRTPRAGVEEPGARERHSAPSTFSPQRVSSSDGREPVGRNMTLHYLYLQIPITTLQRRRMQH
jgi:hypothetical protein